MHAASGAPATGRAICHKAGAELQGWSDSKHLTFGRWSMQVTTGRGEQGTIEGAFGKSGRFRVAFPDGLQQSGSPEERQLQLCFKKYIYDPGKQCISH